MSLITIYFDMRGETIKAIVDENKIGFFLEMGAKRTAAEIEQIKSKAKPKQKSEFTEKMDAELAELLGANIEMPIKNSAIKGDKGSGKPNSYKFHTLKVQELNVFKDIQDYAFKVTGKMIRKKQDGSIEQYQKNALRLIRGYINGS